MTTSMRELDPPRLISGNLRFTRAFPLLFVLLYGSGFVGAKFGLPYASPLTFLALRFAIAAVVVILLAWALRAPWPNSAQEVAHIAVAGSLTVGAFSAGVFIALDQGLSPALAALVTALQPIIVAVIGQRMLGERLSVRQWLGLGLGLLGVALVVGHKLDFTAVHLAGLGAVLLGLLGLSFGNLYQKRYCAHMNVLTGGAIQSFVSAGLCFPFAWMLEDMHIEWTGEFAGALTYMSLGVSIGALSLLYMMIRRGEVSQVASLFYFVPVSAAVVSFLLFGEPISQPVVAGILVTAGGVKLVAARPAPSR